MGVKPLDKKNPNLHDSRNSSENGKMMILAMRIVHG
jgi:hypothetical protein